MSRRALALWFLVSLALALVATVPLRLVLGTDSGTRFRASGLSARNASGSVWAGRLHAVEWRGNPLGDVAVVLDPLSLLTGVWRMELASPDLSLTVLQGRNVGFEQASGSLEFDSNELLPGMSVQLSFANASLIFSDAACQRAGGVIQANVSAGSIGQPLQLRGPLRCNGDSASAILVSTPTSGVPDTEAKLTIDHQGRYQLQSRVQASDPLVALALQSAGFRQTPAGLVRTDNGQLMNPP